MTTAASTSKLAICLQRQCIISKGPITTGPFGPCYVFRGCAKEYSFKVHIDAGTKIESLSKIFEALKGLGIAKDDLTHLHLMGGWKNDKVSAETGEKLRIWLKDEKLDSKVNFEFFQKKTFPNSTDLDRHQYAGGTLFPNGKFIFSKTPSSEIEQMENKAREKELAGWAKRAEEEKMSFELIMAKDLVEGMPIEIIIKA